MQVLLQTFENHLTLQKNSLHWRSANITGELLLQGQLPKLLPSYHDTANTLLCTSQLQLQHKLWLTCLEIICEVAFKLPHRKAT